MLKALYDYGVRQNLTQPPGFSGKTVKAYISLSEDDDHVSIYLGDKESVLCPDIGSLAQSRDKCNILVEKRSIVVPDAATEDGKLPAKSRFFSGNTPQCIGGRAAAEGLCTCTGNA